MSDPAPDEAATARCGNAITDLLDKRLMCEGRVGHPGAHHDGLAYWDRGETDEPPTGAPGVAPLEAQLAAQSAVISAARAVAREWTKPEVDMAEVGFLLDDLVRELDTLAAQP